MANKSTRKKVAKRMAALEKIIEANADQDAVKAAKDEIISLTAKYSLGLEDMLEIDDMVQSILNKN
jgi:hypothetical protein